MTINKGISLFVLLTFLILGLIKPVFSDTSPIAKVVWVSGTLSAKDEKNNQRNLAQNAYIYLHDNLMTDDKSQAQIVFSDNTLLTLQQSTSIKIAEYEYHAKPKHHSVGKYIMGLIEGGFRTVTGLIAKTNSADYQVVTPVATMGVRGTDYAAYFHAGKLYMNYYHGVPFIKNSQGTLILTATNPYASVSASNVAPQVLSQQPAIFNQPLKIIPASGAFLKNGQAGAGGHGVCSSSGVFSIGYQ